MLDIDVVIKLGSLVVFTAKNPTVSTKTIMPYHWEDRRLGLKGGPFFTLYDSMKSYETVLKAARMSHVLPQGLPAKTGKVVHVDFVNKKILK